MKEYLLSLQNAENYWAENPLGISFSKHLEYLGAAFSSGIGLVRETNQDRVLFGVHKKIEDNLNTSFFTAVLCDGVGGMKDGDKCAELAAFTFVGALTSSRAGHLKDRIENAIRFSNSAVFSKYTGKGGSTLTAIVVDALGTSYGVSVGDSRIYEIEPSMFAAKQISSDDTIAGAIAKIKGNENHQGSGNDLSNQLAQFIGLGDDIEVDLHRLNSNSKYLLTSDGSHGIPKDFFDAILFNFDNIDSITAAKRIIHLSSWLGGHDNASAAFISSLAKIINFLRKPSGAINELALYNGGTDMKFHFPSSLWNNSENRLAEQKGSQLPLIEEQNILVPKPLAKKPTRKRPPKKKASDDLKVKVISKVSGKRE